MKSAAILSCLFLPLLLAACGSVTLASSDAPSIMVAQNEERECGQGRILFPAGEYKAEVASEEGIYYKAPERLRTLGVLIGRSEAGGIFVSNATGNAHAAWFGDPKDEVDESPGTLFGAIGLSAPKLWPFKPSIAYSTKK